MGGGGGWGADARSINQLYESSHVPKIVVVHFGEGKWVENGVT